jgi:Na+/glutamate symporter
MWLQNLFLQWGCVPELTTDCQDMTNASSAYLGIIVGAIIGGLIAWLIYSRQKYTSDKQDHTLESIKKLNENQDNTLKTIKRIDEDHDNMLKRLDDSDKRHDKMLNTIVDIGKRIEYLVERQDKLHESLTSSGAIVDPTSQVRSDKSEES